MKIKIYIFRLILILLASPESQGNLFASSLNGTSGILYKNQHHVFYDGESARGFVRMNGGFTIMDGAKATLDTVVSVSGAIDLRETGIMQLIKDIHFDAKLSWSSSGYIDGRGKAIFLNDTLSIPPSKTIHIISDTIIDGNKNVMLLNENAQIIVESNATLTLRNLIIRNLRNNQFHPCIKVAGNSGKLVLDNTELSITGDMNFGQGQLYIHNDAVFSGTSAFIYASTAPCFIAQFGTLTFDIGTTFSFVPPSTNANDLMILQDRTSSLLLNGASLKTTNSGMQMTRGSLFLSNNVSIESNTGNGVSSLSGLTSKDYGTKVTTLAWHPTGKYLVIGGAGPISGNEIEVYKFNGSTLTLVTSLSYGASEVHILDWHPSGQFLAIGGQGPASELRIYSFNGSTLTSVTSENFSIWYVDALIWHPSGKYLTVGGSHAVSGRELQIYRFDGTSLLALTSEYYGDIINCLSWTPDGKILAVGGSIPSSFDGAANTNELQLYSFNGSTLTGVTSVNYGSGSADIYALGWDPAGKYLAIAGRLASSVGGFSNDDELRIYRLDGSTLTPITSRPYGVWIDSFAWHPLGTTLAIGGSSPINGGTSGFTNDNELRLYNFDGTTLTPLTSKDYGTTIHAIQWNPDGKILAIGGNVPVSTTDFPSNTNELRLYSTTIVNNSSQAFSRALIFGNSTLGSSYDLNIEVLGGAYVTIDGKIVDDSA